MVRIQLTQEDAATLQDDFFHYALSHERPDVVKVLEKINRQIGKIKR
jgi:hypothetical protein